MAIEENAAHLPKDILETILARLPVKSLLRFKSVSKSWNTMISDRGFARVHYQLSMYSDSQDLFVRESLEGLSLVRLKDREFQTEAVLETRHGNGWDYLLSCIGDGVALLGGLDRYHRQYMLWNPCTGQDTSLELPYILTDRDPITSGLCRDPSNDDFKVVIASWDFYAVFSCKNESWTNKKEFSYSGSAYPGISADGAIYWVWCGATSHKNTSQILCFDPRDDNFKIAQKPQNLEESAQFFLICLKGCLCLYCNCGDEMTVQIWIKEKGGPDKSSWKVLMNIENFPRPFGWSILLPFKENKIVIRLDDKRFLIYDACEKTYEEFCEESEKRLIFGMLYYPCLDSMYFPVIMKTRPKKKRRRYSLLG